MSSCPSELIRFEPVTSELVRTSAGLVLVMFVLEFGILVEESEDLANTSASNAAGSLAATSSSVHKPSDSQVPSGMCTMVLVLVSADLDKLSEPPAEWLWLSD